MCPSNLFGTTSATGGAAKIIRMSLASADLVRALGDRGCAKMVALRSYCAAVAPSADCSRTAKAQKDVVVQC
jgi:hypothetical protein